VRAIKITTSSILAVGLLAGSTVGVAAQDAQGAAEVTRFTGTLSMDGEELPIETMNDVLPNGFVEGKPGFTWLNRMESSDPRFTGDHSIIAKQVLGPDGFTPWETGGQPNIVLSNRHEVTNDGGSWLGEGVGLSSTELDFVSGEVITFVGQDGYEGLTAYVHIDDTQQPATISGVIFPVAMPEVPDPYTGE